MQNLLLLFTRYGSTLLFIILEVICFYLVVNYNHQQKDIFVHSSNLASGKIFNEKNRIQDFLSLRNINDSLALENARLKRRLLLLEGYGKQKNLDSLGNLAVNPAKVINQTINQFNNYLTINKGSNDGVRKGMGAIGEKGPIGVVTHVSENYATILSLLNTTSGVSVLINGKNNFGVLKWLPDTDYKTFQVEAIPKHAQISVGDSVITSGFSTIYPPNIYIGKIREYDFTDGSSNYDITIEIENDLTSIDYVYLIENNDAMEIKELESNLE